MPNWTGVQLINTDCSTICKTGLEWIGQNRNRVHHVNIQSLLKGCHLPQWSAKNTMLILDSLTLVLIYVVVHREGEKGWGLTKKEEDGRKKLQQLINLLVSLIFLSNWHVSSPKLIAVKWKGGILAKINGAREEIILFHWNSTYILEKPNNLKH